MAEFVCKLKNVRPVAEWVDDKEAKGCNPCLIAPLAGFYLGVLQQNGEEKLASELKTTFEQGDILTISKKLDTIKTNVGEAINKQLRNLDCFAQTFKPE